MRAILIFLIAIIVIVDCQDTTTGGTSSNAFATAIATATATAATSGNVPAPAPASKPDHRPWYIKLRDLGVLNLVCIGIGGVLLLLCIYGCTCFDSRKPPLDYNDIGMTKVK